VQLWVFELSGQCRNQHKRLVYLASPAVLLLPYQPRIELAGAMWQLDGHACDLPLKTPLVAAGVTARTVSTGRTHPGTPYIALFRAAYGLLPPRNCKAAKPASHPR